MSYATTRPASSPQAPVTQDCALVFDFKCIYTHDFRRKRQKRWQDGCGSFHSFNKRVLIYDLPRNLIGDTHLKGPVEVNDGDEIQLDNGVLVEVGEIKGSRMQDITKVGRSKHSRPAATHASPHRSSNAVGIPQNMARVDREMLTSPASSYHQVASRRAGSALLKPMSLNAVLALPRNAHSRAHLPNTSLGKRLQDRNVCAQGQERHRKRQKFCASKELDQEVFPIGQRMDTGKRNESPSVLPSTNNAYAAHHDTSHATLSHGKVGLEDARISRRECHSGAILENYSTTEMKLQSLERIPQVTQTNAEVVVVDDDDTERPVSKLRFNTAKRKKLLYGEKGSAVPVAQHRQNKNSRVSAHEKNEVLHISEGDQSLSTSKSGSDTSTIDSNNASSRLPNVPTIKNNTKKVYVGSMNVSALTESTGAGTGAGTGAHDDAAIEAQHVRSLHPLAFNNANRSMGKAAMAPDSPVSDKREQQDMISVMTKGDESSKASHATDHRPQRLPQPPPRILLPGLQQELPHIQRPNLPVNSIVAFSRPRAQPLLVKSLTDPVTTRPRSKVTPASREPLSRSCSTGDAPEISAAMAAGTIGVASYDVIAAASPAAAIPKDTGPWSRCAFDLFGFCGDNGDVNLGCAKKRVLGIGGSTRGRWMGTNDDYDNDY